MKLFASFLAVLCAGAVANAAEPVTSGDEIDYMPSVIRSSDDGARIVVQYRETMPPPGAAAAQVIVTPYHLVALPRRQGAITFEKLPA